MKSIDKEIKRYIKILLNENIFDNKEIYEINLKLNNILYIKINSIQESYLKDKYTDLLVLTDELAVLSEIGMKNSSILFVAINNHFNKKKKEIEEKFKELYK